MQRPPRIEVGSKEVLPLVIEDLVARGVEGRRLYGMPLTTNNGRSALQDAYEEALDLSCYLKQALMETPNAN